MFEIGDSLRDARVRRGIDFTQAEVATKIRGKYLRALEDEQFDVLPADTYVKGFLRTYAEYLGLDGQLYVDEFNSRFVAGEGQELRPRRSRARPQRRHRRIETNVVLIVIGAIALLTIVVISAWKWSSGGGGANALKTTTTPVVHRRPHKLAPLLTVVGLRGATHVTARQGSASGTPAFDGTVEKGDTQNINGRRLWVQIDAPENLRISIRGHLVHVPGLAPRVLVVTPSGWHPA